MADTIRTHLSTKHGDTWQKVVVMEKLKGWDQKEGKLKDTPQREPFTLEGFLDWFAQWITIDNQVSRYIYIYY